MDKQRKNRIFKIISLGMGLIGAACLLPSAMAESKDNTALIEKARQEAKTGPFVVMVSSPKSEKAHRVIMDAFQKRFDIKVNWEWLPLNSGVSAPRVQQQSQAGLPVPSAMAGYGYNTYRHWFLNKMDMEVDWVGEFGDMFPQIKTVAVDGVMPAYRNRLLRQWDVQYVMVYNTNLVKREDVPKSLWELADPKWEGRFAMSNNVPPPLDIVAVDVGADKAVDLVHQLIKNKARFKAGPPAVVGAIVTGEVAVGASGYTALAEAQKARGAPIDWVPMETLPVGPIFMFMVKDAPQPNLGKLFLAWLATEGSALQEELEYMSLYSNKESPMVKKLTAMQPDIKVIEALNEEQLRETEIAGERIMESIAGVTK